MILTNCYDIAKSVRIGLNEYSDAWLQGTDTTGKYKNEDILEKINAAQRWLYNLADARDPHTFLTSTVLTGVASVYTLPSDFYRVYDVVDQYGDKIRQVPASANRYPDWVGSRYEWYWKGRTIVINYDSFTEPITLWYFTRCRNLTFGMSSAGGALSLTLATSAQPVADFYNGMTIDGDLTGTPWEDTISDYSAARVATLVSQTGAANKYYGLVSELPEGLHHLIAPKALLLMKESMICPIKPTRSEQDNFTDLLNTAMVSLFGSINTYNPTRELFE